MATDLTPQQQRQVDYEKAHPTEFGCSGLNTFTIIGIVIITVAVCLRFWSRRLARIAYKADDYLLFLALVSNPSLRSSGILWLLKRRQSVHKSWLTSNISC